MNKELVISVSEEEVQIALLEDKNLVELHKEKSVRKAVVGDVMVGQVHKIMPGLNAAFISLDGEKDGFMHYIDLGPEYNSFNKYMKLAMNGDASTKTLDGFKIDPILPKTGNISDVLSVGQLILTHSESE